jgi:hypothetical protein
VTGESSVRRDDASDARTSGDENSTWPDPGRLYRPEPDGASRDF